MLSQTHSNHRKFNFHFVLGIPVLILSPERKPNFCDPNALIKHSNAVGLASRVGFQLPGDKIRMYSPNTLPNAMLYHLNMLTKLFLSFFFNFFFSFQIHKLN